MDLIINIEDVDDLLISRDDGRALAGYWSQPTATSYLSEYTWDR